MIHTHVLRSCAIAARGGGPQPKSWQENWRQENGGNGMTAKERSAAEPQPKSRVESQQDARARNLARIARFLQIALQRAS
jgi:hypothetical protein